MQAFVMPGWDGLHDFMDLSQDKLMWLHAFGRRKPGVTIADVQAEMNVLFRQILEADYSTSMTPLARKAALNQNIRVRAVRSGAFHGREEFSQQWTILSGLGRLGSTDCVRQYREPPAGARDSAYSGSGDSPFHWVRGKPAWFASF